MTKTKLLICPYCGDTQGASDRCRACGGLFEPLSRQATHNAMGPWFLRDPEQPFRPGCSYDTLLMLVDRGVVTKTTIVRGPTTKQFWTVARRVPGLAHRLGCCHECSTPVDPTDHGCHACGVPFSVYLDRNFLGLPDVRPMPWDTSTPESNSRITGSDDWMANGGRLSSFATDAQLFGESVTHVSPAPAVAPIAAPSEAYASPSAQQSSTPEPSTHALRRQLAHQKRQMQIFGAIALGGLIVVCILITLLVAQRNASTGTPATTGDSTDVIPSATEETETPISRESTPVVVEQSAESAPTDGDITPVENVIATVDPFADIRAVLTRVRDTLDVSADDRLAWLHEARTQLDEICDADADDGTCTTLREEIAMLQETLELDAFFAQPDP
ncbi:MAG: hypothetical protein AAF432_05495 [Planctomycetota bacterium]